MSLCLYVDVLMYYYAVVVIRVCGTTWICTAVLWQCVVALLLCCVNMVLGCGWGVLICCSGVA